MDSIRWQRAEALFLEGLELKAQARAALIERVSTTDPALADTVRRMLEADAASDSPLDGPTDDLVGLVDGASGAAEVPKSLGRYEILRPLGRGGMSTVYLARRADGRFDREVALKVVPVGFDPDRSLRRFRSEVAVLARLEHAHIARLYDAGIEEGSAWLAMERVVGRPIDEYCRDQGLEPGVRLSLFLDVCAAVQFAHQNLVVHSDLKPSNILIDEQGQVKLLDFGIATLLEPGDPGDGAPATRFHAMTVEYASPEQVQGLPVTTASDVYSLGVVLYELLTGDRPIPRGSTPLDTARAVVDVEPPRPSARAPGLKGDLDTILLKALSKDPGRRYSSVEALLDDVRRHLDGRPVRARPQTVRYRMAKFARRNRLGVTAAASIVLTLVGGLGVALWQASEAQRQRDVARLEAEKARRVTEFLVDVFEVADPEEARGDTLTAAQILDRGAVRVEASLAAEPELQATMLDVIGRVYQSLSLYDRADSLRRRGLAIRREHLGPDHPDVAASLHGMASLAYLRADDAAADTLFDRVIEMRRADPSAPPHLLADALVGRAFAFLGRDEPAAEAALDEALSLLERADPTDSTVLASALYARGFLRHSQARYGEAEALYREVLALRRSTLGEADPATLTTLSNLGSLLRLLGRYEAADSATRRVYEARLQIFGPSHARVANSLVGLAEVAYDRGDYAAAEAHTREALAMRSDIFGADHQRVTFTRFYLARVLQARGDLEGAAGLFEDAISRATDDYGRSGLARMLNDFAGNLEARGDLEGAEVFYLRAWNLYRSAAGPEHPFTAIVQGNIGTLRLEQGDLVDARVRLGEARRILEEAYGPEHATVGVVRLQAATADLLDGDPVAAELELREALGVLEDALPPEHWRIGQARLRLGAALADQGRLDEADRALASSRAVLEPWKQARVRDWRRLLTQQFEVATAQGRAADAEGYRAEFLTTETWLPSR